MWSNIISHSNLSKRLPLYIFLEVNIYQKRKFGFNIKPCLNRRYCFCHLLVFRRMQSHCDQKIGSDGAYFHALFGLLISRSSTIRSTRAYVWPSLIIRFMHSYCERDTSSDGAYHHALFGLFIDWISTTRCTRDYFWHYFILRRTKIHCEKKISSDGAYLYAFFGFIISWSRTIKCTRYYFYPS